MFSGICWIDLLIKSTLFSSTDPMRNYARGRILQKPPSATRALDGQERESTRDARIGSYSRLLITAPPSLL